MVTSCVSDPLGRRVFLGASVLLCAFTAPRATCIYHLILNVYFIFIYVIPLFSLTSLQEVCVFVWIVC